MFSLRGLIAALRGAQPGFDPGGGGSSPSAAAADDVSRVGERPAAPLLPETTQVRFLPLEPDDYVRAEVVTSHCERHTARRAVPNGITHDAVANAAARAILEQMGHGASQATANREAMAKARQVDIDRNRTAYPMRGRFHCCDPRTVQTYNVDTGEARVDCVCELCGWSFQGQRYESGPDALPPPSADCNEPGAPRLLGHLDTIDPPPRRLPR